MTLKDIILAKLPAFQFNLPVEVELLRICNDYVNTALCSMPSSATSVANLCTLATDLQSVKPVGSVAWMQQIFSFVSLLLIMLEKKMVGKFLLYFFYPHKIQRTKSNTPVQSLNHFTCYFMYRALYLIDGNEAYEALHLILDNILKDKNMIALGEFVVYGIVETAGAQEALEEQNGDFSLELSVLNEALITAESLYKVRVKCQ